MNKIILLGRVGADPEVRYLESGSVVADCTLATSQKYKTKDGEKKENTQWHNLVFWNNQAKVVGSYVTKGDQILVEGLLDYDKWQTENGDNRIKAKIRVLNLTLLGGSERNRNSQNQGNGESMPNNSNPRQETAVSEDDLPF